MSINIPHADALVEELEERVTGVLTASEPRIESVDKYEKSSIDIAVDGEKIGTVDVFTYENAGVPRVHRVRYEGRMPGYVNEISGNDIVGLRADEFFEDYDEAHSKCFTSDLESESMIPNNTAERPMYRQDGHTSLKLADHEADGILRKPNPHYRLALFADIGSMFSGRPKISFPRDAFKNIIKGYASKKIE
jgi:hypothetical protein